MADEQNEQWILTSWDAVADFYGVARDTVRKDWKARGMPCQPGGAGQPGHYDVREISRWLAQRIRDQSQSSGRPVDELQARLAVAEVEAAEIDAKHRALKYEREAGLLVSVEDVEAEVAEILNRVRGRAEQIPAEVSGLIPPEYRVDLVQTLRHKFALVFKEIADWSAEAGQSQGWTAEEAEAFGEDMEWLLS